jgi:hypothetical protein
MEFDLTTIEHLGLKLYVSLPPVIGELVSNAWDADSKKVEITFPKGAIDENFEVIIRDYGGGMTPEEVQMAYLHIGRNPREELGRDTSPGGRKLQGRKGIGKLSAFGVASELEVRSIKNGMATCIRLDYEEMKAWPKGKPYEPKIIEARTGKTADPQGTEIIIRKLYRSRSIDENLIRKELARRYTIIGNDFEVFVNTNKITQKDKRLKEDCKKVWDVSKVEGGSVVDQSRGWTVSGWVGLLPKSSQIERGVDIFARGKAVELETMFGLGTTTAQFARAYVVGEVNADFLDEDEDDISTGRNSVHWESEAGQKLKEWGSKTLLWVFDQWLEIQHKEKEEETLKDTDFKAWLESRTPRERKIAERLFKIILSDKDIEPESAKPLLEIIKSNVEFQAFQELVEEIEASGGNVKTLLTLFKDWRIIEARENLKLLDGRTVVMAKLYNFIEEGALEVQEVQPLFEENGWLINPSWAHVTGQTTYTEALRKQFKEPEKMEEIDRRMDILGYCPGGWLNVVELKRPEKTLSRKDLDQIEEYVDWARNNLIGNGLSSPAAASGLLVIGKLNSEKSIHDKMERLAGTGIKVVTFRDLLTQAEAVYGVAEKDLKKIAPEYAKSTRKTKKKKD